MYAGKGNEQWLHIVKECTKTIVVVQEQIYLEDAQIVSRATIEAFLTDSPIDTDAIQCVLTKGFQGNFGIDQFLHAVLFALQHTFSNREHIQTLDAYLRKGTRGGRNRKPIQEEARSMLQSMKPDLQMALQSDQLNAMIRFARTQMYLNCIMHRSNLPIFCCLNQHPIFLVPFSYLLRYSCLLSYVGHMGDGSSYGLSAFRRSTIGKLLQG